MRSYFLSRDLERRFDGDMPVELRQTARTRGHAVLIAIAAGANSACCDRLALAAARATAVRRADGDLPFWRSEGLFWREQNALYADNPAR